MSSCMDNKTPLGKVILKRTYLNGKNQAWLAKKINVSPSHLSILCTKTQCPKSETLLKISQALDIEISELYAAVAETVESNSQNSRQTSLGHNGGTL